MKIRFQHTGKVLAWLIRGLAKTLTYEVIDHACILHSEVRPPVIWTFWHNRMFLIPWLHHEWFANVPGTILTSPSGDGQIIADVCAVPLFDLRQVWAHSDRLNYGYELKGALNLAPPITEASTVTPR